MLETACLLKMKVCTFGYSMIEAFRYWVSLVGKGTYVDMSYIYRCIKSAGY